jgi:Tfp pilus assembly protein PilV
MIEAVAAAALLVVIVLGVLKGLDTANQSSGREKARAVAAALTEQDQERLRSFRAVDLANYDTTRDVTVNNIKYTIESKAEWVRDSTGGTESCNNSASQADYMRIVSKTTSGFVTAPIPPITMASLVAAPIGAFSANQGTLGVQVNDRDGVGVPGLTVSITGPANLDNPTNAVGCAIFAYVPAGSYTITLNQAGSVDPAGRTISTKATTVTAGGVSIEPLSYDEASSVTATFDTV